jgi:hypothetical protein
MSRSPRATIEEKGTPMTNRQLGLAAAAAVAALSACSKSTTASAPSVRTKAATYGSSVATNLQGAVDALNSASSLAALNNGLAPLQHAFGGSVGALSPVSSGTPAFLSSRRSVRSFARLGSSASTPGTALTAEQSSTLEQFLSQRVFTDANVESSDGSSVTFLLHGDDVCPYVLPDGSRSLLAASGGTLDAGCAEDVDQQQIRVKASEPASDALDLALLIGPARAAPLTLELRTNSVAAVVSLDGVKGVLEFEHTLDAASPVPQAMTGVVDLKVVFNRVVSGKVDVTFSSSVRQAVDVQVQDATGTTTLATAARSPWASLQVNGIDQAVAAQLDLGPTTVSAPYYVSADNAYRQEVTSLAGMSFSFSAQDGQAGDFVISNLGLGDARTSVSLAGQDVFRADLDPRHFAISFKADPSFAGRTIFTLEPGFQLTSFFDRRPYGNTDPVHAGRTYTWSLSAAAGKPQIEPYEYLVPTNDPYVSPWATAVKVVTGTLTLSDGESVPVTVPAGACLVDSSATGTTSLVQQFVSAECP